MSLILLGVPLAFVIGRLVESSAVTGLQRDAARALVTVPDSSLNAGAVAPEVSQPNGTLIGVYDATGRRVAGRGPTHSALARQVADGRQHEAHEGGDLSVVIPIPSDAAVVGSVRASTSLSGIRGRTAELWGLLSLVAALVIAVATMLARRSARRIAEPFEHLTRTAGSVGSGDYRVELPRWGMAEADAAALALHDTAQRVDALVKHEREFMNDASHQLRTPLAGILIGLEAEPPRIEQALAEARHLQTTIEDLVALRALDGTASCRPDVVAAQAVARWTTDGRQISLRCDTDAEVALAPGALRQCLDVLLDNSLRHGACPVTVTVEPLGDSVVVEVADSGPGFARRSRPGTGLDMTARIVERAGGSLVVRRRSPRPRIALLLPAAVAADQSASNR